MGSQSTAPPPPQPPEESFARRYKFLWPLILTVNLTVGVSKGSEKLELRPRKMSRELLFLHGHHYQISRKPALLLCTRNFNVLPSKFQSQLPKEHPTRSMKRASLELLRPNTTSNGKSSLLTIAAIAGEKEEDECLRHHLI
ncbi:hypothetical protein JCGZ_24781 [Jatropha curcas]|uniref:Uncharacterized protein n=1 Tax=Jatropha curcas TaxID=180498 RepID=A0A067KXD3_JATCU|nr:hypothetical protein JCGZ_24781 [Jatropha curcas]